MTGTYIFDIVIGKLNYWEELSPIILFIIDKSSKVDLQNILLSLSLTISLRIECNKELLLDSKEVI